MSVFFRLKRKYLEKDRQDLGKDTCNCPQHTPPQRTVFLMEDRQCPFTGEPAKDSP